MSSELSFRARVNLVVEVVTGGVVELWSHKLRSVVLSSKRGYVCEADSFDAPIAPEVIAAQIVEDATAGIEAFAAVAAELDSMARNPRRNDRMIVAVTSSRSQRQAKRRSRRRKRRSNPLLAMRSSERGYSTDAAKHFESSIICPANSSLSHDPARRSSRSSITDCGTCSLTATFSTSSRSSAGWLTTSSNPGRRRRRVSTAASTCATTA